MENEDAKTLKLLEDMIRRVVREELARQPVVMLQDPWLPIELPWKYSTDTTW